MSPCQPHKASSPHAFRLVGLATRALRSLSFPGEYQTPSNLKQQNPGWLSKGGRLLAISGQGEGSLEGLCLRSRDPSIPWTRCPPPPPPGFASPASGAAAETYCVGTARRGTAIAGEHGLASSHGGTGERDGRQARVLAFHRNQKHISQPWLPKEASLAGGNVNKYREKCANQ